MEDAGKKHHPIQLSVLIGVEILPIYELNRRPIFLVSDSSNCSKITSMPITGKTQRRLTDLGQLVTVRSPVNSGVE